MKRDDLIEALQKLPPDTYVVIANFIGEPADIVLRPMALMTYGYDIEKTFWLESGLS